jgi:hypothetical protein
MNFVRSLIAGSCVLGALGLAAPAAAGPTYSFSISQGVQPSNAGVITLTQVDLTHVTVLVDLLPNYGFINTGGPHTPFTFNLAGTGALTISTFSLPVGGNYVAPNGSTYTLSLSTGAPGGYENTPFGTYNVAIESTGGNGSAKGYFGDLLFTLERLTGLDTNDFVSNLDPAPIVGGSYFSADLSDNPNSGNTGAQAWAIRSIRLVPEPVTISLFGMGVLGLAAMTRRRKTRA